MDFLCPVRWAVWFLQLWHYQGNITWRLRCSSTGPARPVLQFHITACLAIHPVDPANEIMGGRAKDILWELIPFMPKPTSDFYSEALFRCKTHLQLDKALGGLKEKLCVFCFVWWLICRHSQEIGKKKQMKRLLYFQKSVVTETHLDQIGVIGLKKFKWSLHFNITAVTPNRWENVLNTVWNKCKISSILLLRICNHLIWIHQSLVKISISIFFNWL